MLPRKVVLPCVDSVLTEPGCSQRQPYFLTYYLYGSENSRDVYILISMFQIFTLLFLLENIHPKGTLICNQTGC